MGRPAGTKKPRPVHEAWAYVTPDVQAALVRRHPTRPDFVLLESFLLKAKAEPMWEGGSLTHRAGVFAQVSSELANACRGLKPKEGGTHEWLHEYALATGARVHGIYRFANAADGSATRRISVEHLPCKEELTSMLAHQPKVHVLTALAPSPRAIPPRTLNYDQALVAGYFEQLFERYEWTEYRPSCSEAESKAALAALVTPQVDESRWVAGKCCMLPRYQASKDGTTCRLFDDIGWHQVPRLFVTRAFPDWRDLDLTRCYTAVITMLSRAVGSYAVAAQLDQLLVAPDFWEAAARRLNTPVGTPRAAVKKLVQARQFGATKQTAWREAQTHGASFEAAEAMVKSKLFAELGAAYAALRDAVQSNGLTDAYGEVVTVGKRFASAAKALHWVCSTYELRIIARVYEVASERDDGRIMRHMHDGVDVRGSGAFVEAIQAAVATEATVLGIRTQLVEKLAAATAA